jgi:RNase adaptor protein for sRNA GlmZ degradation
MQAMGAYGYRGFHDRKPRFLHSVPYAAKNIDRLLEGGLPVALAELESVFHRIVDAWADSAGGVEPLPGLTVHVHSFSYRQGYPDDHTGHGGGFVFDCRSIPNPGRLPEYESQTGRDPDVMAYIEGTPVAENYWAGVVSLVDASVEEYRRRKFSDLTVSFGCTGGQHRSVYFAERLTRHLRETFPDVGVRLVHREQNRWPARETTWTR